MIIKKHGYTVVTDIANNPKYRQSLRYYDYRIPLKLNQKIFIFNEDNMMLSAYLNIDDSYMDDKQYANGNAKTSRELKHLLENILDGLTLLDVFHLHKAINGEREIWFSEFLNYTHNNTKPIYNECIDWNYSNSNNLDMDSTRKITLYNDNIKVFRQTMVECEYTGNKYGNFGFYSNLYQDALWINGRFISKQYYEDYFLGCEHCGNEYHSDDMYFEHYAGEQEWDVICTHCVEQFQDAENEDAIRDYSYKPDAHFRYYDSKKNMIKSEWTPSNKLNIGIEVEMERRDGVTRNEMLEVASEINEFENGFLYCKYDSSIETGFEIVSHPATFNAFRKMNLNDAIFRHNNKFKSFRTGTCGMHIHISRNAFSYVQLHKFILMINEYKSLTHLVSQRRNLSEYDSWANFSTNLLEDSKYESARKIKRMKQNKRMDILDGKESAKFNYRADTFTGSRYQVVNLRNSATIEIRSFKGNISEIGFRKNLDFVESMFYFCKDASLDSGLNIKEYVEYVRRDKKTYKYLNKFFDLNKNKLDFAIANPTTI